MAKRTKTKLAGMDFESLMNLREQVEDALSGYRATLEKQLASLGSSIASLGGRGRARKTGKGMKVAPKYRSPSGETWAGRGATPRWLVAAMKEGKSLESFAIDKAAAATGGKPKRKAKRRTKK
jgi:DNA-binding protein H-NS